MVMASAAGSGISSSSKEEVVFRTAASLKNSAVPFALKYYEVMVEVSYFVYIAARTEKKLVS
jgi:hypothetical protein